MWLLFTDHDPIPTPQTQRQTFPSSLLTEWPQPNCLPGASQIPSFILSDMPLLRHPWVLLPSLKNTMLLGAQAVPFCTGSPNTGCQRMYLTLTLTGPTGRMDILSTTIRDYSTLPWGAYSQGLLSDNCNLKQVVIQIDGLCRETRT